MPPVREPSPMTTMTLLSSPFSSLATLMPSPAEMEVEAWPVSRAS